MGVKVRERKPGEWWIFIDYRGDRRATKVGAKRAALELKADIEKKIKDAEFQIKAPPPARHLRSTPRSGWKDTSRHP